MVFKTRAMQGRNGWQGPARTVPVAAGRGEGERVPHARSRGKTLPDGAGAADAGAPGGQQLLALESHRRRPHNERAGQQYRADEGGAALAGRGKMIAALEAAAR